MRNYTRPTGLLLLAIATLLPIYGRAGGSAGGGGNAKVCFVNPATLTNVKAAIAANNGWVPDSFISDTFITSVQMLDTVEAHDKTGTWDSDSSPVLISPNINETSDQLYARILDRFKNFAPGLVDMINVGAKHLKKIVIKDHGIGRIDDIRKYEIVDDDKCMRFTILAQFDDGAVSGHIEKDPRFFSLPESVFSKLDRVVARIHEYAYYTPRHLSPSQATSDSIRPLVGLMITTNIQLPDLIKVYTNFNPQDVSVGFPGTDQEVVEENITFYSRLVDSLTAEFRNSGPFAPINITEIKLGEADYFTKIVTSRWNQKCESTKALFEKQARVWYESKGHALVEKLAGAIPVANLESADSALRKVFTTVLREDSNGFCEIEGAFSGPIRASSGYPIGRMDVDHYGRYFWSGDDENGFFKGIININIP